MLVKDFPNCCTLSVIVGLGGSSDANVGRFQDYSERHLHDELESKEIRIANEGHSAAVVTTTTEQKAANKVLRERGYRHSAWMSKELHPETKLRIWWKPVEEMKNER